jgi:hypothetical protein
MVANDNPDRIGEVFADGRLIDEAMQAAAADTVDRHRRARVPLVVFRDGRIDHVPPDSPAPNLDILLADTDFSRKRTAKDLVAWRQERLSVITSCLAARPLALAHKGLFKQFIEGGIH